MLEICKNFFGCLNSNNIRYCHWKSNAHLEKALNGGTDLDILVHKNDKKKFQQVLTKFEIQLILSPPGKRHACIEDYLGFDSDTGVFIHLHVHYQLIIGPRYIKNYHLPFETVVFENLLTNQDVAIPIPEIEFIILFIRAHLKISILDILKFAVKSRILRAEGNIFPENIDDEFFYLQNKFQEEGLSKFVGELKFDRLRNEILEFNHGFKKRNLNFKEIINNKIKIRLALKPFKLYKNLSVNLKRFFYRASNQPIFNRIVKPKKKTLINRGLAFAFVGADGSGKSTLTDDIKNWLSWKLTVEKYYYGIPKNSFTRGLFFMSYAFSKIHVRRIGNILEKTYWIYLARKRYGIYKNTLNDVQEKKIVLTDRFPLKDFQAMKHPMDGPRVWNSEGSVTSFFGGVEKGYYDKIKLPDTVFVLKVGYEELKRRKGNDNEMQHRLKADMVNAIQEKSDIIPINAEKSYDKVLLEVKRLIWLNL